MVETINDDGKDTSNDAKLKESDLEEWNIVQHSILQTLLSLTDTISRRGLFVGNETHDN